MDIISKIREKAKIRRKRVVLPEGTEERMIKAAKIIVEEKIADVTLLGNKDEIKKLADVNELSLTQVEVIEPFNSPNLEDYSNEYLKLREKKGMTIERAKEPRRMTIRLVKVKNLTSWKGLMRSISLESIPLVGSPMRLSVLPWWFSPLGDTFGSP